MLFCIVRSALPMRASSRSIIFSLPAFCSISRPEMEIATACLSDRVLGGGKHVGGRDRQDVVAGIAFEGSVFRILDFLNDCLSTIEGLDLALLRQAAQQRVVLGDVI